MLLQHNNRVQLTTVASAQKPFQHTKLLKDFHLAHIITARCTRLLCRLQLWHTTLPALRIPVVS